MSRKSVGESLYVVKPADPSASTEAFTRKSAKNAALLESWFRDAIAANPELVIAPCREAGLVPSDERWLCWSKEFGIATGSIDILLLSSNGRIGIVETKLSYNPQVRREVVAQLLDYALWLNDYPSLPTVPSLDGSPIAEYEDIEESLTNGNFLLVIAGDALDPRAIRLGKAVLAQHLTSMWDLAMVDMNLFYRAVTDEYLLVPELRGTVEHETRQTMRVIIKGESPEARIEVERVTKNITRQTTEQRPDSWTIEEACGTLDGGCRTDALRIFNYFNSHPLLRVEGGRGPKQPTLSLYVRTTNDKIGTSWFTPSPRQLHIGLGLFFRARRLLELHNYTESELTDNLREKGFTVPYGIQKDGLLGVNLPWDVKDETLEAFVRFVTGE